MIPSSDGRAKRRIKMMNKTTKSDQKNNKKASTIICPVPDPLITMAKKYNAQKCLQRE